MLVQKPVIPFPNRPKGKKDQTHIDKIGETFSHIKINILLLDGIQQIPPYAEFLKELCITKSIIVVPKRALLASNISLIISSKSPVKYKDLSSASISSVAGGKPFIKPYWIWELV